MNVLLKPTPSAASAAVAHAIMAYDRATDALVAELPVPRLLDSLALKIAAVPAEDARGALSYPLTGRQAAAFGFLLGLPPALRDADCFLESVRGRADESSAEKREALAELGAVAPLPRRRSGRLTEGELVVPVLRLLEAAEGRPLTPGELARGLAGLLDGSEKRFERQVRAMIARRAEETSFIRRGLAACDAADGLRISAHGQQVLRALRCN